ncbi:unnamed protein product [Dovyalis caffra]|uniref:Uncharacterized protein n=1 Tax=Dovyalis caffra TaxID=77055 RepID=A0AAV1STF4_9ROSI|nr:unnamed protein product [Dovyalis caffra]
MSALSYIKTLPDIKLIHSFGTQKHVSFHESNRIIGEKSINCPEEMSELAMHKMTRNEDTYFERSYRSGYFHVYKLNFEKQTEVGVDLDGTALFVGNNE